MKNSDGLVSYDQMERAMKRVAPGEPNKNTGPNLAGFSFLSMSYPILTVTS
jgi:hypothetical protein